MNSQETFVKSSSRGGGPTLKELENVQRRINDSEQIKKIYDSTLRLAKVTKDIVRSKPFAKAIRNRQMAKRQVAAA